MKRVIKYGVLAVIGVLVLGFGGILLYMDSIAKAAIERGGTYALGVDVALGKADVQPFSGRFDMQRFSIDNPEGFGDDKFLELDDGGVAVTLATLRSDTVEMGELKLSGVDMRLVRDTGKSNYGIILENLKRFESSAPQQQPSESGKQFVIREINLEDITVHVGLAPLGQNIPVNIDKIQLKNIGSGGDPVSMAELIALLLKAVLKAAVDVGGNLLPADMVGDLQGTLAQLKDLDGLQEIVGGKLDNLKGTAGESADKAKQQLEDKAGEAKDKLDKTADDLNKKLEEESKKIGEGLKGLLPPKKKEDDDDGE